MTGKLIYKERSYFIIPKDIILFEGKYRHTDDLFRIGEHGVGHPSHGAIILERGAREYKKEYEVCHKSLTDNNLYNLFKFAQKNQFDVEFDIIDEKAEIINYKNEVTDREKLFATEFVNWLLFKGHVTKEKDTWADITGGPELYPAIEKLLTTFIKQYEKDNN